jgi:hypothetical protein
MPVTLPPVQGSLSKNYYFTLDCGTGLHNLTTATLKIAFTDTAPTTATHVYTDISSPLALTNMATSVSLTGTGYTQTTGTATLAASTWTGTSQTGDFGPFRYIVLYNDSATSKNVIGWWDYGSEVTLHGANGDQFVITFDSGILTNA